MVQVVHLMTAFSATMAANGWGDAGLFCDFEQQPCKWHWSRFVLTSAAQVNASIYSTDDPGMVSGPVKDADDRPQGT